MKNPMSTLTTAADPASTNYLDHRALIAKVSERDFCDFPTAWAIQEAGLTHASERCSAVQARALLCDCGAVMDRWRKLRAEAATLAIAPGGHHPRCACSRCYTALGPIGYPLPDNPRGTAHPTTGRPDHPARSGGPA